MQTISPTSTSTPSVPTETSCVGVVAIGRNEGDRLRRCLESITGRAAAVVYVDSGSNDDSISVATELGADIVKLDLSTPFTAARARNAGFQRLLEIDPAIQYVQFVDSDCEIVDRWLERAEAELAGEPKLAVVCGRRRERYPDASIYNRLCDIEWNTPIGEAKSCGGDAMMRVSAFRDIEGFNAELIAGEEPELCARLRQHDWRIQRIDAEMTLHDAAMTTFGQWWKRNIRAGHAYAEGAALHGSSPQQHNVRQVRSNWVWGLMLPSLAIIFAVPTLGLSLLAMLAGYAVLFLRISRGMRARLSPADARLYAFFTTIGKIPAAVGQVKYWRHRATGRRSSLLEYKAAPRETPKQLIVAYLVNQYPMTTQSFIRREIAALEAQGVAVQRFSVRRWNQELVDPADQREQQQTRVVLDCGAAGLMLATIRAMVNRPLSFLRAASTAYRLGRRSGKAWWLHWAYLAEACVLRDWIAASGARHVHAHFGTNSTTVAMLCRMLGGPPYSFTCHGPEEFDMAHSIGLKEKMKRCAFVVGISSFGCSQLRRFARYEDWLKIRQVHCGVDAMFLEAPRVPIPSAPRVVNIGRIGSSKGQLFLIQAAAKLLNEGTDLQLTIVGDGWLRKDAEALIERLGVQNHIRITGWMSNQDVREQILQSRALVMPSFAEGLPLVIMETLALGRPVLSTYVAGIPELVQNGVCGWLVPAGAVEELISALREVLSAPVEKLQRMGDIGAQRVAQRHSAKTEARKLAELFRESIDIHS